MRSVPAVSGGSSVGRDVPGAAPGGRDIRRSVRPAAYPRSHMSPRDAAAGGVPPRAHGDGLAGEGGLVAAVLGVQRGPLARGPVGDWRGSPGVTRVVAQAMATSPK